MSELHITPQFHLRGNAAFDRQGNGLGLLALLNAPGGTQGLEENYFRRFARDFITRLCNAPAPEGKELAELFAATRPVPEAFAFFALEAPLMMGGEFLDGTFLARLHGELEAAVQAAFKTFQGDFPAYLRSLGRHWQDVGKVSFHLAENKGATKEDYPFAFMASFIHRLSENDKPKHLPLAAALKAYAHDRAALQTLLAPIQHAAQGSELIRELLESRRVFQPAAWTPAEAYAFLKDIPVFEDANIVVRVTNLWKERPPTASVSVSVSDKSTGHLKVDNLLYFSADVTLDGQPLTRAEIGELLASEGGLVRLRGQWVEADPARIARLLKRFENTEPVTMGEGLRALAGLDDGLTDDDRTLCRIQAAGKLKEMLERFGNPASIEMPPLPDKLAGTLRHYQTDGVKYLNAATAFGMGVCLADDMGLGKTLQTLSLLTLWKNMGRLDGLPVLLVLPATLLANWKHESAAFTPDLNVAILHPSCLDKEQMAALTADPAAFLASYDLALISYGMLTRLDALRRIEFPAVIADEAQAIKNPGSKQSLAVRAIRARCRIALTGTPVENHLTDLWSLFDFINPGLLGTIAGFKKFLGESDGNYASLRRLTRPFILRRLKTDKSLIPDLPDKTEVKAWCSLSRKQAALYEIAVKHLAKDLEERDRTERQGIVFNYLMQFKQICNHPAHFSGSGDFAPESSGKFQRLAELAEPIAARQEKLLVFTQFREMTEPLHDHLTRCFGRPGLILHGGTPVHKRRGLVDAFQTEDGPPFFVLSLKAAGVGLNLTAASHVIHFDRWWNPAVENQATDRAFRIGQKRNVLVHKFICAGTLEERIDEMIASKQGLADELLSVGAEQLITAMSNNELLDFLKLDLTTMEQ